MEDQPTCGKGLAANSPLPAKMGELANALAEVLEIHTGALDLTDEASRQELDAYRELVKEYREIASRLQATARRMAGYRDLPMGRHHPQAMAAPKALDAFERFVKTEQELLELLQDRVKQDLKMLVEMVGAD